MIYKDLLIRRGLTNTSHYVNLKVDLSYEKIEPALRNCNDIDKLKRLQAEANDLEKTLPDWDFKGLLPIGVVSTYVYNR